LECRAELRRFPATATAVRDDARFVIGRRERNGLIIGEAQVVAGVLAAVRGLVDEARGRNGRDYFFQEVRSDARKKNGRPWRPFFFMHLCKPDPIAGSRPPCVM